MTVDGAPSGVDRAAATAFLAARFGGADGLRVASLGAGAWSRAYGFSHAGRDYVIRFGARREDFDRDRIAAGFSSPALPVPRVVAIGAAYGGFFAITERATGTFLEDADATGMRRVLPALLAALDAMRDVDLSASVGYGLVGETGNAPFPTWQAALLDIARDDPASRIHGWRARLAASPDGAAAFDAAYARMAALAARCPDARHVIHSDLLNRNVLIADDRITAVFDWGCMMVGDFLYDLAWLTFWAPWYPAWRGIDFTAAVLRHAHAIGLPLPDFETRLRCYALHIGLAHFAYNAFLGTWSAYAQVVARTMAIISLAAASPHGR